jgi:hypothetical protein
MGSDDAERLDGGREQDAAFDAAAGDVAHVDEALGGGALTQHPRRSVVNQRVRRTVAKGLRRAIEVGFYRHRRFPPLVAHLSSSRAIPWRQGAAFLTMRQSDDARQLSMAR